MGGDEGRSSEQSGRVVVVAMRPKPECDGRLEALIEDHVGILREEGLATDRAPVVMRAADGTFIEVFEWASADAIEKAHDNPRVTELWGRFAEVCDFIPAGELQEFGDLFSEFAPV